MPRLTTGLNLLATMAATTFTAETTKKFFEDADQMALNSRTVGALKEEGIEEVQDLLEFKKDDLTAVFENLRKPDKVLQDEKLVAVEPFKVSAKSQKRLIIASNAVRYYAIVGRSPTPSNMHWAVLSSFDEQWEALLKKWKKEDHEVPKLTKGISFIKWLEAFKIHLRTKIGARGAPLAYLIRDTADL